MTTSSPGVGASAPAAVPGLTYVVADIHGRFDLLTIALQRIWDHAPKREGGRHVVFTGDYVDRGPQSRKVLDRLMAGPQQGWRWTCLKGNHEDMMWAALSGEDHPDCWIANGGRATMMSFGGMAAQVPLVYLDWLLHLPPLCVDRYRVYVHAGVDPTIPLERQSLNTLLWSRMETVLGHGDRHVIHGHTPDPDGPRVTPGRTNLDTMAFRTGRLVVAVFDDALPGPPIKLLECRV